MERFEPNTFGKATPVTEGKAFLFPSLPGAGWPANKRLEISPGSISLTVDSD